VEIVGSGFLARNLDRLVNAHPDTVVLAAGVSSMSCTAADEFAREADLVYRTARRCLAVGRRLVFFSSGSAAMYGAPGSTGREDGPIFPPSMYGRHKLAMEAVLAASGVDYLALRLTHVIGPHQPDHQLLPGLVRQLRAGTVDVHRGAHRDVLAADDFVTIVDSLLASGIGRTVVNVGSGFAAPVEKMVAHLDARLGTAARWCFTDRPGHYPVSTEQLARLVPEVARLGFDSEYYQRVFDRYLELYR
jgi:nucleoside-diphosphate-sugar epimerase